VFRRSECVILTYLCWAAMVAATLPVRPPVRPLTLVLNLTIVACYALLAYADALRRGRFLGIVRDWFPFPLLLLAYREMGWFALPRHAHPLEARWVVWDQVVLRGGAHAAIELLGPFVPSLLEIAYSLVYVLGPFSVALLYLYGRRDQVDRFLFPFSLGVLLCYAQFPFWPSEPPRTLFPGEDLPSYATIFRRFNLAMLSGYGIHTSVFPSAHTAGAFSAAFAMWGALAEHRWVSRFLLVTAVLIATATVYGRYHYLADAVAGVTMALVARSVARAISRLRT